MSANQKVALVTGGTRGIGLAITQSLRKAGYKVAVVGRSEYSPDGDLYIQVDLSNHSEVFGLSIDVSKKLGGLDVLVNNAGIQSNDWQKTISLMLTAPYMLSKDASLIMEQGSHIINILSTASFQGARGITPYVVAKHGLLGLTRAMAIELAPKIAVNAVAPGLTDTDMVADMTSERRKHLESITPAGRFCTPDEIANAVMFLVNSTGIYGQTITVDGGWMAKNG